MNEHIEFLVKVKKRTLMVVAKIDIDVIYAKQSRKHLVTLDLEKMEIMAPVESPRLHGYKSRAAKIKDFSSKMANPVNPICEMYYDSNKCFRIEPDERLFKAIKDVAPFKVYTD